MMYTEEVLQPHVFPPYVFVHLHSGHLHTVDPAAHSSMSVQLNPSPTNPAGHLHPVPGSMSCGGGDTYGYGYGYGHGLRCAYGYDAEVDRNRFWEFWEF